MSAVLPSPSARLARSREQLRLSLSEVPREAGDRTPRPAGAADRTWVDVLSDLPVAGVVVGLVRHWWSGHPLRAVASVVAGAANAVLKPVAARHPWGLVAGALVLGGLLAWSRPWRWALTPVVFAGVLPRLLLVLLKAPPSRPPAPPPSPPPRPPPP